MDSLKSQCHKIQNEGKRVFQIKRKKTTITKYNESSWIRSWIGQAAVWGGDYKKFKAVIRKIQKWAVLLYFIKSRLVFMGVIMV